MIEAMAVQTFTQMLRTLSVLLDKGAAFARAQNMDEAALIGARLAPDMYPLSDQVRITCFQASNAIGRLTDRPLPSFPDKDETLAACQQRIAGTLDYIAAAPKTAFDGAEDREIVISLQNGARVFDMDGLQMLRDWAFPQFYFHIVTAYDILRHLGVAIGKQDYAAHAIVYLRPGGSAAA